MDYMKFYDALPIRFDDDPFGKAMENKKGRVVKFFDIVNDFGLVSKVDDADFKTFIMVAKKFYMVPLDLMDERIIGFTFRSKEEKSFYKVSLNEKYPFVYGLQDFRYYEYNKSILICEGAKDAEAIKKIYPFCIAYLTVAPEDKLFNFLNELTNRILFFPDNDKAGRKLLYDKEFTEKFKYYKKYLNPYGKDVGIFFDKDQQKSKLTMDWLRNVLVSEGIIEEEK